MKNGIDRVGCARTGFQPAWRKRLSSRSREPFHPIEPVEDTAEQQGLYSLTIASHFEKQRALEFAIQKEQEAFDAARIPLPPAVSAWLFSDVSLKQDDQSDVGALDQLPNVQRTRDDAPQQGGWLVPAMALANFAQRISKLTRDRAVVYDPYGRNLNEIRLSNLVVFGHLAIVGDELAEFALVDCVLFGRAYFQPRIVPKLIFDNVKILGIEEPDGRPVYYDDKALLAKFHELLRSVSTYEQFRSAAKRTFNVQEGRLTICRTGKEMELIRFRRVSAGLIRLFECATKTLDCVNVRVEQFDGDSLHCLRKLVVNNCQFGIVSFIDAQVSAPATFRHMRVAEVFNAQNAKFARSVPFYGVNFGAAPIFHDCEFPSDTEFHGCTFGSELSSPIAPIQLLVTRGAYRALRVAMNKAKATEAELYFFEREQRASRHFLEYRRTPISKSLSLFYDMVSRYGTAPGRALGAFCVWNLAFAILFCALMAYAPMVHQTRLPTLAGYALGFPPDPPALKVESPGSTFDGLAGFGLAVQNAINPLALATHNPMVKIQNGSLFWLSVLQGVVSAGILTLFLLAVRNRFQRSGGGSGG